MGVVYYLAREDNRTLFELGKWHALSDVFEELRTHRPWAGFVLPDEDTLRTLLRASIADKRLDVDSDAYTAELARRIVNFGRDSVIHLANDYSSDEYLDVHFKKPDDDLNVVDSAYSTDWGDWEKDHPAKGSRDRSQ